MPSGKPLKPVRTQADAASTDGPARRKARARRPFHVLIVDHDESSHRLLREAMPDQHLVFTRAADADQARQVIADQVIDLAMVDADLQGDPEAGARLAAEIRDRHRAAQVILMSGAPSLAGAVQAIRAGASDFLAKPLDMADLNQRVRQALDRNRKDRRAARRVTRLRKACKRLNHAHEEVTQQVDILCNDLVTAYQELAAQMQDAMQGNEFAGVIEDELDLEAMLRKTLEFLLDKGGPTNAAIFLPSSVERYTLGGYVNLDRDKQAIHALFEHLGDNLAPRLAQCPDVVHLDDPDDVADWTGAPADLGDVSVLGFAAGHDDETLAVIVLFRDAATGFADDLPALCRTVSQVLGESLARVIRIHHRHIPGFDPDIDDLSTDW